MSSCFHALTAMPLPERLWRLHGLNERCPRHEIAALVAGNGMLCPHALAEKGVDVSSFDYERRGGLIDGRLSIRPRCRRPRWLSSSVINSNSGAKTLPNAITCMDGLWGREILSFRSLWLLLWGSRRGFNTIRLSAVGLKLQVGTADIILVVLVILINGKTLLIVPTIVLEHRVLLLRLVISSHLSEKA